MNTLKHIKTYADLAKQVGNMILANHIPIRRLQLIHGDFGVKKQIFEFYLIQEPDFLLKHTDELVFYDDELHLYVWGITHSGSSWNLVPVPHLH